IQAIKAGRPKTTDKRSFGKGFPRLRRERINGNSNHKGRPAQDNRPVNVVEFFPQRSNREIFPTSNAAIVPPSSPARKSAQAFVPEAIPWRTYPRKFKPAGSLRSYPSHGSLSHPQPTGGGVRNQLETFPPQCMDDDGVRWKRFHLSAWMTAQS